MGHFTTVKGSCRNLEEIVHISRGSLAYTKTALPIAPEASTAPDANFQPRTGDDVKMASPVPEQKQVPEQKPINDDASTEAGASTDDDVEMNSPDPEVELIQPDGQVAVSAGPEFVKGLGIVLSSWVKAAAATPGKPHKVARFHSAHKPPLEISDYLKRVHKYFFCSDECFVIALVYIDRVSRTDPSMTVCDLTVHRLLFTAVMLAAKFHDDTYYSNAYYAKAGGLSLKEVNVLEACMLKQMQWKLQVHPSVYQRYYSLVCKSAEPDQ